jgi:hypothetical protein
VLLKYQDDIVRMQGGDTVKILDELRARALLAPASPGTA